jgi:hypothetical protein
MNTTSQSGRTPSRETSQSLDCIVDMKSIRSYISILGKMQNEYLSGEYNSKNSTHGTGD